MHAINRIQALTLRYLYLLRGSWPRIFEMAYWPTMQMILWGFINQFMAGQSAWVAQAAGVFLAAILLWDVLFRSQLGITVVFLEEMYSRNLGHLFVSPLRPIEWLASLMVMSMIRTIIGVGTAAALAWVLYEYSIFSLGLPLLMFFVNLIVMGWAIGLIVAGLLLRYGLGMEGIAWGVLFAFAPISGVYYPISSLPDWLEPIAWSVPASYVFEGMRAVMIEHIVRYDYLLTAVGLNVLYLTVGVCVFLFCFHLARKKGLLLQVGE